MDAKYGERQMKYTGYDSEDDMDNWREKILRQKRYGAFGFSESRFHIRGATNGDQASTDGRELCFWA